jgi:hypothetical protein
MSKFLVIAALGLAAIHYMGGFKRFINPRSAKEAGKFLNVTKNTFLNEFNKKPTDAAQTSTTVVQRPETHTFTSSSSSTGTDPNATMNPQETTTTNAAAEQVQKTSKKETSKKKK